MISGLNHISLSVSNLEKSFEFYTKILGCQPIAKWKKGAYLLAGEFWLCLSLDELFLTTSNNENTHISFSIPIQDFDRAQEYLTDRGIKLLKENNPHGNSIYILDPDNHKLELHVGDLWSTIAATKNQLYEDMEFF
jgi:catechol 2,3-dioxygenase-like lactoylglutathione lyase family enzyme